jgi:uncharacterized protein (DUF2384 family)
MSQAKDNSSASVPAGTRGLPSLVDQVRAHALDTFGDEWKATHWFNRPSHLFGGRTPAEVLETDPESVDVELGRIDHGIFA